MNIYIYYIRWLCLNATNYIWHSQRNLNHFLLFQHHIIWYLRSAVRYQDGTTRKKENISPWNLFWKSYVHTTLLLLFFFVVKSKYTVVVGEILYKVRQHQQNVQQQQQQRKQMNMNNNNICNTIYKLLCIAWNVVVWLIVLWRRWRWWWSGYAHIYINACIPSNCLEIK
jgi:hypothetical protein